MYRYEDIRDIHLEVTSRCQARCPMCPRRIKGGVLSPNVVLSEISLMQFKQWLDADFIKQLTRFFMCGNLGDPIIAKDTLGILQYVRQTNPQVSLSMHTNGSARTEDWWKELAATNIEVVFGIDGLEDTNHLYRVGTNWHNIMHNAKSFIDAGGNAKWHMLAFKHNEHQIEECKQLSIDYGFKQFDVKHTSRFFASDRFEVLNESEEVTHVIYPTDISRSMIGKANKAMEEEHPIITCKVAKLKQIYISATGVVTPCCWLDMSWLLPTNKSAIDYCEQIKRYPNLNSETLRGVFDSGYFDSIANTWQCNPLKQCARVCGSFDRNQHNKRLA